MGVTSALFVWWATLVYRFPEIRPKWNVPMLVFGGLVVAMFISGLVGSSFSVSFWSTFERLMGVMMWIHASLFLVMMVSVFRSRDDWNKLFFVSFVSAIIGALFVWLGNGGFGWMGYFKSSGAGAFGNSSYAGSYLMLHIFIGIYLLPSLKEFYKKIIIWVGFVIILLSPVFFKFSILSGVFDWSQFADAPWRALGQARAAIGSLIFGGIFWWGLALSGANIKWKRVIGWILSSVLIVGITVAVVGTFVNDSKIQNLFSEMVSHARVTVWDAGFQAFKEKPILGWGPENFDVAFQSHFPAELFLPGYGGEVWFDRAHNSIVEQIVTTGIVGTTVWLTLYITLLMWLWKRARAGVVARRDAIFITATLVSHFLVNLTVFDTPVSFLPWLVVVAFAFWTIGGDKKLEHKSINRKKYSPIFALLAIAGFVLFIIGFAIPFRSGRAIVKMNATGNVEEFDQLFKRVQKTSIGKYNKSAVLAEAWQGKLKSNLEFVLSSEETKVFIAGRNLKFDNWFSELSESYPENFKIRLGQVQIIAQYDRLGLKQINDIDQNERKEALLRGIIADFPGHPYGYWFLAEFLGTEKRTNELKIVLDQVNQIVPNAPITMELQEKFLR